MAGEFEMEALAAGAIRVLSGKEEAKLILEFRYGMGLAYDVCQESNSVCGGTSVYGLWVAFSVQFQSGSLTSELPPLM